MIGTQNMIDSISQVKTQRNRENLAQRDLRSSIFSHFYEEKNNWIIIVGICR